MPAALSSLLNRLNRPGSLGVAFALIAVLKLVLLGIFGPIHTPDTAAYIEYAKNIAGGTGWLHHAGLADTPIPILAMRMAGYPAILAAAMVVFGSTWEYAIVIIQSALSFVAGYAVYRVAVEVGLPRWLALTATVINLLSLTLTFDQCLLTDSFNCSLIILATAALTYGAASGKPLAWRQALIAGVLFALAFLIREALQFLVVAFVPLIIVRVWIAGKANWQVSLVCCALILLPLYATGRGYQEWNFHRTGERFVSTVPQLTILFALGKMADIDPHLFDGDTPVDRAGHKFFKNNPFGEIGAVNHQLFTEGYKATDIARMAYAKYFEAWREHTSTMVKLFRRNTSERVMKISIRPIGAICETIEYGTGQRVCYDYRDLYRSIPKGFSGYRNSAAVFFLAQTVELTLAVLLFLGFLIGTPFIVVRRFMAQGFDLDATSLVYAAFWSAYVIWYMAYGLVHVEDRYVAPVLPLSIICGIFAWRELWLRFRPQA